MASKTSLQRMINKSVQVQMDGFVIETDKQRKALQAAKQEIIDLFIQKTERALRSVKGCTVKHDGIGVIVGEERVTDRWGCLQVHLPANHRLGTLHAQIKEIDSVRENRHKQLREEAQLLEDRMGIVGKVDEDSQLYRDIQAFIAPAIKAMAKQQDNHS